MHFIIEFSNCIVQLSSVYNICAIKSMIVLEMKCPQLSKPEATAARNENSIGDRMEKKTWEKPGSVGRPVPLRRISSLFQLQQSQSVSGPLVPGVFPGLYLQNQVTSIFTFVKMFLRVLSFVYLVMLLFKVTYIAFKH